MIIDAHAHIASWPSVSLCKKNLLSSMEKYHINYALVSHCDCSEFPSIEERYPIRKITQRAGLKECLDFAKRHHGKIGVLVWVNPHREKLSPAFKRLIENNLKYIHGFKFHPFESKLQISDIKMKPYLDYIEKLGLPLLVHTAKDEYSSITELGKVAKEYPSISFIAAHLQLCTDNKKEAVRVLKENPNVFADTAWVKGKDTKKVLRDIGIDRMCFGTDNPIDGEDTLQNPIYQEYFSNALRLTKKEKEHLMCSNALKIFHIDPKMIH